MTSPRIDVHHHIAPPLWIAAMKGRVAEPLLGWSVERSLEDMDQAGVGAAIVSLTVPGVGHAADGNGATLARACNEFASSMVAGSSGRFGFFAALPLPDIDGSLREIEYALEHLGADGVCLFTSYGDRWLGNPAFDPVMEELDRRNAVIYTHPDAPHSCRGLIEGIKDAIIEYGADTTRAIASIIIARIPERFPNLSWVFSHGGGVLPMVHERLLRVRSDGDQPALDVSARLGEFFYDIAQVANPIALPALARMVPPTQILWGTDFPYRSGAEYVNQLAKMDFSDADRRRIEFENALHLLSKGRGAIPGWVNRLAHQAG
jgi:predicted TIM-barrel fold metal-dependent hydrolase